MLTVCNNERVAVTIEVKILAFPKREEGGSEHDSDYYGCNSTRGVYKR